MDKKKYISPEMEIIEFDSQDVIVTSNLTTENDETPLIGQQ